MTVQRCKSAEGLCKGEGRRRRRVQEAERLSERGQAPSRERAEARPQQARLGWHAVPTLPETRGRLGQHVVLPLPKRQETKGEPGTGKDARRGHGSEGRPSLRRGKDAGRVLGES